MKALLSVLGTAALAVGIASTDALAADSSNAFRGKTITINVGAGAGGGYTFYARVLAEFIGSHIPGHPNVIVQNMPGAGGIKLANYMQSIAPKDGTVLGFPTKHTVMIQILGASGVKYDAQSFGWIGNMDENQGVLSVLDTAPAKTIEEVKTTELVKASTGRGSETFINPAVLNHVLGTKFKIVTGYKGAADMDLAIEQGEVHGRGCAWAGWKLLKPDWVAKGRLINLVQFGLQKDPDLAAVPLAQDLARTDEQRLIFEFLGLPNATARAIFAPPGTPEDRLKALRAAFDATIADPAMRKEAEKQRIDIAPRSGEDVQRLVKRFVETPKLVVEKVRNALGLNDRADMLREWDIRYAAASCVFAPLKG